MLNLNPIYCVGGVLVASGLLLLLVAELVAWKDSFIGNTISERMWGFNIPLFLYMSVAIAISAFVTSLAVHFWAKGRWGL